MIKYKILFSSLWNFWNFLHSLTIHLSPKKGFFNNLEICTNFANFHKNKGTNYILTTFWILQIFREKILQNFIFVLWSRLRQMFANFSKPELIDWRHFSFGACFFFFSIGFDGLLRLKFVWYRVQTFDTLYCASGMNHVIGHHVQHQKVSSSRAGTLYLRSSKIFRKIETDAEVWWMTLLTKLCKRARLIFVI